MGQVSGTTKWDTLNIKYLKLLLSQETFLKSFVDSLNIILEGRMTEGVQ